MEIYKASELGNDIGEKISAIFVEGFYRWLKFFSRDQVALTKAFTHMFNPDLFYVALVDNVPAGIAACPGKNEHAVKLAGKELARHLGLMKGTIAYMVLKKEFQEKQYPFPVPAAMGLVEFVASSGQYRRKGVARGIINHIIWNMPYREYVLEVADTNVAAIRLYEKLGFREFMRVKGKHRKWSGVNYLMYMKYSKI